MAYGWDGFKKILLVILKENKVKILSNDFDTNLMFMSNIGKIGFEIIHR